MGVRWADQTLRLQNRIQKTILPLCFFCISGSLAIRVMTSGNVTSMTGSTVTLTCDVDEVGVVIQVEWYRCDGRKVLVFHREFGESFSPDYQERISGVTLKGFTLLQMRANDSGAYCCKLSTFPHGTLQGSISLLLQAETAQVPSSQTVYIVGGVVLVAVLGVLTALLMFFKGRRSKVRHPVHVTVHTQGLPRNHQSFLQASPPYPKKEGQQKKDVKEEEEGTDYFSVMTSDSTNGSSNPP
ncbi:hypothetical protein AGOR_G00023950 [Albula goreensis]|uniref:Ig-like domain-containing protein n=1 Tax=Albula goreensis TaxID=1534307 RepID=A0A8T3E1K1_9TELE|nr:hypothetical protein AGOR_G00023950 [Albula goreensis]